MVPKFYFGDYSLEKNSRGFYLILEDLSGQYRMKIGPEGLNFNQVNDILVKIAGFHAVAYAYNMKNENFEWESWQLQNSNDPEFFKLVESCFDDFIKDLRTEEPKLVEPISNLKKRWLDVYKTKIIIDERFISHGDLWINNVMVNER